MDLGFSLGTFALRSHQGHKHSSRALKVNGHWIFLWTFALRSHQGHKPSSKALKLQSFECKWPLDITGFISTTGDLLSDFCPLIAPRT
ncbi:hypothetical protein ACOSQ3_032670 [Xanthoceras sorbifolium]